ncbi:MAG: tetratricopeptide repeat protein [Gammaproteobacteria bacterium]
MTAITRGMFVLCLAVLLNACATTPSLVTPATGEEAVQEFPADASDRYARALGYMDAGDDGQAAAAFRALATDYPDYAGPLVNLAIIESRAGNTADGIALLENAVVICTHCAPAWNQLGILLRRQGQFAEAEKSYQQALNLDPDYALAHYNLGVLYDLYQQQPAFAVQHYERYVALNDDDTVLVDKWITDLRRRIGEPAQAAQAEEL